MLGVRRHGENAGILDVFTPEHGRHLGVMRGATSRKIAPILQPGAQLDLTWRARLNDHVGSFTVEPVRSRSAMALGNRLSLAGLNAVAALLMFLLPEREPQHVLYARTEALLDILDEVQIWPLAYLKWEMAVLEELGFGLDLRKCAVTGSRDELVYVSPKSGRAVSREGAGEWADRLLPLPLCMLGQGGASDTEIAQGLKTTGYFLMNRLAPELGHKPLPDARQRFVDIFLRRLAQGED